MTAELSNEQKALVAAPNFATIGTIDPDGRPQLSVVWVELRDGEPIFSTVVGRKKYRNLERDPRCTVLVQSLANPYQYVEVRGTAYFTTEGTRELIDKLAQEYVGADRYEGDDGTNNERVIVHVKPEHVTSMGF